MSNRRTLVFWDHSFHIKTRSFSFLKDLLKRDYEIVEFWDESWLSPGKRPDIAEINRLDPFGIIFCQMIPPASFLRQIRCANKLWVPMYDHSPSGLVSFLRHWRSGLKVLSFCKRLSAELRWFRFPVLSLQYYPEPLAESPVRALDKKLGIFFWQRIEKIAWPFVKKIVDPDRVGTFYLRDHPDPGQSPRLPGAKDMADYSVKRIDGWLEKSEYERLLKDCDVMIASRPFEGIGLTFLEAMGHGLCVVSPDEPVANEYIRSGENGILYNVRWPRRLDLSSAKKLGRNAWESVRNGRARWDREKWALFDFIERSL